MQNVNDAFQVEGHKIYKQRLHVDKEPLKPGDTNDPPHKNQ